MRIPTHNAEGYPDPTTYQALTNVWREQQAREFKPCVFICSPFAGDIEANLQSARRYLRFAVTQNTIPFAPHLLYPQVLEEDDPAQRELGLFFGLVWLGKCDELWIFGDFISVGMKAEIAKAEKRRLPIRYFTEDLREVTAP